VCIDDTGEADAHVPDRFKALHFTRLPGGEISTAFAARVQELLSARRG
jgi:hypothetical protein